MKNEIVLFESTDNAVKLEVAVVQETVWLTQSQMTCLFGVDRTVITRHIGNIFREGELEYESNVQKKHIANADRPTQYYNLDVIISVGYRVKSQRGVEISPLGEQHTKTIPAPRICGQQNTSYSDGQDVLPYETERADAGCATGAVRYPKVQHRT